MEERAKISCWGRAITSGGTDDWVSRIKEGIRKYRSVLLCFWELDINKRKKKKQKDGTHPKSNSRRDTRITITTLTERRRSSTTHEE